MSRKGIDGELRRAWDVAHGPASANTIRGGGYHLMCRGDRREAIFHSDSDRELFLRTLAEACERSGMVVHSYVLMSNHYHLLAETPEPYLVAALQWFQGTYTQRFNLRHRVSGHLFQGRFKAILVKAGGISMTPLLLPEVPQYAASIAAAMRSARRCR